MSTTELAPLKPPRDWFEIPEADQPTPLTFTADGQVYGHLAIWDTCHTGLMSGAYTECVRAPRSRDNYSMFHLGVLETDDGSMLPVGKVTFGTDHARPGLGLQAASSHYGDSGAVGAFVRAVDGQRGIWLSGALRSDLSREGLRDLRANPPSGDWRMFKSNLELIAALAVPVPALPIPRAQLAFSASVGGDLEVSSLILPGYCECEELVASVRDRAYMRRKNTLMWKS